MKSNLIKSVLSQIRLTFNLINFRIKQELLAYGIGNIIISFFSGFPGCVGLSRTVIFDDVGGQTQVI